MSITDTDTLTPALHRLAEFLNRNALKLATAESCTGGMLASTLTSVPGSSAWYEGGFVTYRISAKTRMLDIDATLLDTHGAVSEAVALQMARQALAHCNADLSISTTGLAGPEGDGTAAEVGTLWIGWAGNAGSIDGEAWADAQTFEFHTDRQSFRETAVAHAIQGLLQRLGAAEVQ